MPEAFGRGFFESKKDVPNAGKTDNDLHIRRSIERTVCIFFRRTFCFDTQPKTLLNGL